MLFFFISICNDAQNSPKVAYACKIIGCYCILKIGIEIYYNDIFACALLCVFLF